MANDGNSSDNVLAKSITSGFWRYNGRSWKQDPQPLPRYKEEDDIHQTVLKNYLVDFYNLFHEFYHPTYTSQMNSRIRLMKNIIRKMNQYRQKHWYWKAITL